MSRSWDMAIPQAMQQHGGRNRPPPKSPPRPLERPPGNESEGAGAPAVSQDTTEPAPSIVP